MHFITTDFQWAMNTGQTMLLYSESFKTLLSAGDQGSLIETMTYKGG